MLQIGLKLARFATLGKYSDLGLRYPVPREWVKVSDLHKGLAGNKVWLRGRVSSTRMKGKGGFLILRERGSTAQCVAFVNPSVPSDMVKFIGGIPCESVVDVMGVCKPPLAHIAKCSQSDIEVDIQEIHVVSRANSTLPMQFADAAAPISAPGEENDSEEGDKRAKVTLKTRLDNRCLDLRTGGSSALVRVSAAVCSAFRGYLESLGFVEIHTPKLLGGASEGGANVFPLTYFSKPACLAQSPQLHKQMAIMGDLDRVYEIGPVFRAEDSNTHRHLCEFTGLDLEMTLKNGYTEVMEVVESLFRAIFRRIEEEHRPEIEVLKRHFPYITPFVTPAKPVILTFNEAVELLNQSGFAQNPDSDLSTEAEKHLGRLIKASKNTDFYLIHRYPTSIRPFYTLQCEDDPRYSCSFDGFMRGEEVVSGGQRIHSVEELEKRVGQAGTGLKDYLEAFRYGAYPHGGCGIGLERVVMLYFGLGNVRRVSLFPRDPKRLSP